MIFYNWFDHAKFPPADNVCMEKFWMPISMDARRFILYKSTYANDSRFRRVRLHNAHMLFELFDQVIPWSLCLWVWAGLQAAISSSLADHSRALGTSGPACRSRSPTAGNIISTEVIHRRRLRGRGKVKWCHTPQRSLGEVFVSLS